MSVWLGGEGSNELGGLAHEAAYADLSVRGVLHALLDHAVPGSCARVVGGVPWSKLRKMSARPGIPAEAKNVLRLVQQAEERQCEVVAFMRDSDEGAGRDGAEQRTNLQQGIQLAREWFPHIRVVGQLARPCLEGWVLAAAGETGTEAMSKAAAQRALAERCDPKDTAAFVEIIDSATSFAPDAHNLRAWVDEARAALGR